MIAQNQGFFALSQPCLRCQGNGTIIEHPCEACGGSGVQHRTRRYAVKIPAGVKDGSRIRIKGKGEAGLRGGPAGDLYVGVRVEEDELFERRGDDVVLEVPVTVARRRWAPSVTVPTPGGGQRLAQGPGGQRRTAAPCASGARARRSSRAARATCACGCGSRCPTS